PPGTSPRPVCPALSVRITMLRVKYGACAPLRLSSMLSCPATGTTRMPVTTGVAELIYPSALHCAHGQPADEEALGVHVEDGDRDGRQQRGRHQLAPGQDIAHHHRL